MDGYHGYVESGASSVNAAVKSELYTYIYPSINQRVSRPTVFFCAARGSLRGSVCGSICYYFSIYFKLDTSDMANGWTVAANEKQIAPWGAWVESRGPFLSRISTLTRDIDIAILSVRLSVCLSVHPSVRNVPVLDENGSTYCHSFFIIR